MYSSTLWIEQKIRITTISLFKANTLFNRQEQQWELKWHLAMQISTWVDLEDHFLKGATDKPLMWFRYIDDIFFIWTHGEEKLTDFSNFCNSFDPHIKFEQTKLTTSIPFLDVQVINSNGKISTDLYTKPTDTHQYLNWTSCHPRHTKTSIPYSLALRLRRICSTNDFFWEKSMWITQHSAWAWLQEQID